MKFIYPAVFRKNEEGRYKAFFPDLACCESDLDLLEGDIVSNIQVNIRMYDGWDE